MPINQSSNRNQLQVLSLEKTIDDDAIVRIIDLFVQTFDPQELGFQVKGLSHEGRPAYAADVLIGLYLYGYLNGIRSSRKLARECKRNVELWWLLGEQKPCFKTIANFRKDNQIGFENLFVHFREFCLDLDLYGKQTIAIDGSKFRAQNSMKNNYNQRKIDKHLDYIDQQYEDYLKELDQNDQEANAKKKANLDRRRSKYDRLQEQLNNTEETQISTTDPDARALPLHMRIVEVGYNLQSSVDDKHNLIVAYEITNKGDHRALAGMALRSKEALQLKEEDCLTVLADKGYHTGEQPEQCHKVNIDTYVAAPKKPKITDKSKPAFLRKENFDYSPAVDTYTCPNEKKLTKQGRYTRRKKGLITGAQFDRYTIKYSICKHCDHFEQCVSKGNRKSHQGRYIDRYLTDGAVQQNKINIENNRALYKKRQAIVEHPFGTIKRQWGYNHTLMKTIPKVQTEFSIIMLCYNIRRAMSILSNNGLKKAMKSLEYLVYQFSYCMKPLTSKIKYSFPLFSPHFT